MVARSALVKHETFSIFLAPVPEGMRRWQKVFMVTTLIFAFLTVDVWRAPRPPTRSRDAERARVAERGRRRRITGSTTAAV